MLSSFRGSRLVAMPATTNSRGLLKAATNRVRTSTSIQGSDMWESVIGVKNEERGANAGVEALLNAPRVKQGMAQAKKSRQTAAAEAMKVTGNFNTEVFDYDSLISLAKAQGAVGNNERRGACKVCGQVGHLTKQCRNQFSKFFVTQSTSEPTEAQNIVESDNNSSLSSLSEDSRDTSRHHRHKKRRRRERRQSPHQSRKDRRHRSRDRHGDRKKKHRDERNRRHREGRHGHERAK